jgi:hypothetical protein
VADAPEAAEDILDVALLHVGPQVAHPELGTRAWPRHVTWEGSLHAGTSGPRCAHVRETTAYF